MTFGSFNNPAKPNASWRSGQKAGLVELVRRTPEEYIDVAARLARDPDRLSALRAGLRARVAGSAPCDGSRTTRELERVLRAARRKWCRGRARG